MSTSKLKKLSKNESVEYILYDGGRFQKKEIYPDKVLTIVCRITKDLKEER